MQKNNMDTITINPRVAINAPSIVAKSSEIQKEPEIKVV